MCGKIYDVDLDEEVTPLKVRDAILTCFVQAHAEVLESMKEYHKFESEEEFRGMAQMNVSVLIKAIFKDIGADFDHPTKQNLSEVLEKLAEYAVKFRSPEIVKKHYAEIMLVFNKLK